MRVLVIDNYDSFVYNLVQYLAQLGAQVTVRRNDEVDLDELDEVDGVLVSPGPGTPERAGASIEVIRESARRALPVLGVCLGHQAIGVAWGGVVEAVRHRELPVEGVQFHPESVLTQGGHRMLANWMAAAGHPVPEPLVD